MYLRPDTQVQIGIGAGTYSPIDPGDTMAQLDNAFKTAIDFTAGGTINPDPGSVGVRAGTVCYDLSYSGGARYDRLLLRLTDRNHLRVRYDATASAGPSCAAPLPDPDGTWAEYVR